ncbi:MAG: hypothetical protein ABI587_02585 [Gemmatimonadales bacterium]
MTRKFFAGVAVFALMACGAKGDQQAQAADSLQRDLQLAPAESTTALNDQGTAAPAPAPPTPAPAPTASAPKPKPKPTTPAPAPAPAPKTLTLASGLAIDASAVDSLHSRHNNVGESFRAAVSADVKNDAGQVVIPAGSVVTFKVSMLKPAQNKSSADGSILLDAQEVSIDGQTYALSGSARTANVQHALEGQGVTAGGAARVGGGAAAGAVGGKVIGGKTGAIIGGIAGAAGGAILASKTADRDVVVRAGDRVTFTLGSVFTITR